MDLEKRSFGPARGHPTDLHVARDPETGFEVHVSNFGATLVRVKVPDRTGSVADITYGQDSPAEYMGQGGYLGATVGRVANRIGNARFELDGRQYTVYVNNAGKHCLHGGKEGFDAKVWECTRADQVGPEVVITMRHVSPADEEGFPGTLTTHVTYTIAPMRVSWAFRATTDAPTIVNLTNHAYWNLDGLGTTIDALTLKLAADRYMPADETLLPAGEVLPVAGTPLDLHEPTPFEHIFAEFGDVDNNFFLEKFPGMAADPRLSFAAELASPVTGRRMVVRTTEPCVQLYTGNFMGDLTAFGAPCPKHGAVCLETQRPPNAINLPEYAPWVILRPGQTYVHQTSHEFVVD